MGSSVLRLATVVSAVGGLLFGYELAIISGALLQLRVEFGLSCVQQEALVSSLLIGALLASVVGGCVIDHRGRRSSILLSNVLTLTGSLLLLSSSYPALVAGRLTVGFAMCISSMSCCIFVSEMVTPDRRGFLVTLYEAGITVGILAAYAMNYILSDSKRGWKWMFGAAIVPALIQLGSVWFLPPSAEGSGSQRDVTSAMENHEVGEVQYSSTDLFQRKDNMRSRTVVGLGLVLFQQFTGQPNVLFYASTIFHSVGFHSDASAVLASVGLGLVKVVATVTSMVFSDRAGRRPLLIGGCSVMAVCLVTIGLLSGQPLANAKTPCSPEDLRGNGTDLLPLAGGNRTVFDAPLDDSRRFPGDIAQDGGGGRQRPPGGPVGSSPSAVVNWIVLLCLMAVVSAYAVGFGPMTWLLLSEIFPAAIRGRAFAFINCFNWAANLLVTFTFLNFLDVIGLSGMFLLYGMSAVAAAGFFYFTLPETKGKTLEEIDKELRLNRFYHSEGCCGVIGRRSTSPQYQRVHCQVSTSG